MGKTKNTKRLLAGVLALAVLLALLLCSFCMAAESDHDCTGEDCAVCALLRQCDNLLRCVAVAALLTAALAAVCRRPAAARFVCSVRRATPVSARVRLNN